MIPDLAGRYYTDSESGETASKNLCYYECMDTDNVTGQVESSY